jgi:vacuolar-type H+-ATPase catalytic subunit A/Vma1
MVHLHHWHIPLITQDKHFGMLKGGAAANPVSPGCGVTITLCK